MNQLYNIPNKIKQPSQCCCYCGKTYKSKTNMDKHIILCELLYKSKRSVEEDEEALSLKKMYIMLLELGKKYNSLEEKVNEFNKFVINKKKKINVLEWLNTNIHPQILFEKLYEKIIINDEDINFVLSNSFNDTVNEIFSRTIYNVNEYGEYPIFAFVQKSHMFYIYDKINEDKIGWQELTREKLIGFLSRVHMKLYKSFCDWKKTKTEEIRNCDSFAIICDKTIVKLMSVELKQETCLSKLRSSMYSKMKTDMKALIEYEFEF